MSECKHVSTPMPSKTKLTKTMSPISPTKQLDMQDVPYAIIVSKLMYLVINIQPDLAYVVSHCIQFMTNPNGLLSNESSFTQNIQILGEFSTMQVPSKNSFKVGQMLIRLETHVSYIHLWVCSLTWCGGNIMAKQQLLSHLLNPSRDLLFYLQKKPCGFVKYSMI
jgi:hypothetical protein